MNTQHQFPTVHWLWGGGISYVYEVHPHIVIYETFSQHPPCPSIIQCFFYTDNGIFLEYMRDISLSTRIQDNHIRNQQTKQVTEVKRLEPLSLRKRWMNDLAQAIAFLESLDLAHGDLRPDNILLDRDQLKVSDFDCTAEIGTEFEACIPPYGRLLNSTESDEGRCGTAGFLGPRTELFVLGSLYYLINYGFEVYGDRRLTEDPKKHGPEVVDLLQNMVFPELNGGDSLIDDIIDKCWHNKYATVGELAAYTEMLVDEGTNEEGNSAETSAITESRKMFCRDLEQRGLLRLLSSGEPEHLGFGFEWYRYSS
ncbi:kinase domain-containing protein [Aspergillus sclerotioniger CBS 115572]|uniref:Kinase domain-containing protein n=1 Tax=Aspergillus sclerotioniger CBS 115572 TaxID=1450535 RepID=A0A317VEX8_9EURO|nr:kinase domain-containing protein [Aspergillus sclerotioniger CBS 115572]PWY72445.1 kinase domain-containing protein [Aspergillus sclerotioniger CBS 115572]